MSARLSSKSPRTLAVFSFAALFTFGAARSARAAAAPSDDPFAGDTTAGRPTSAPGSRSGDPQAIDAGDTGPQKQGPPAAPEEAAPVAPAFVQQLPATAYPEPTRGLYGGSLWLDMQGLQWPYTPQTGIGLSGYGWIDTMYKRTRIGDASQLDHATTLFQQGRFLFRVTPTYTNGQYFVQAQAEIVANKDQINAQSTGVVDADDVWVRTGHWKSWDLTFGRFQAFDVYPLGMGLDLNSDERTGAYDSLNAHPTQLYAADFMLYRPAGAGDIALHVYPWQPLRLEFLAQWGNTGSLNAIGGRPAAILDFGWVKFRGAYEYQYEFSNQSVTNQQHTQRNRGGAGSVQFVLAPWIELGGNIGYAVNDEADTFHGGQFAEDPQTSGNKSSYGGFANLAPLPGNPDLLIGVGGNYAYFHNLYAPVTGGPYQHFTNLQAYLAVQYLVYRQLFVKVVGGYSKSHLENTSTGAPYDDDQFSVRLRVMYLY
jgi:hypothetical protein